MNLRRNEENPRTVDSVSASAGYALRSISVPKGGTQVVRQVWSVRYHWYQCELLGLCGLVELYACPIPQTLARVRLWAARLGRRGQAGGCVRGAAVRTRVRRRLYASQNRRTLDAVDRTAEIVTDTSHAR